LGIDLGAKYLCAVGQQVSVHGAPAVDNRAS
jgi:hypothetical protein